MFAFSWVGSALASCAATCACQACGFASQEGVRRSARLAYCVLFTLAMVEAWVLRDFARPLMEKLPCERTWSRLWSCCFLLALQLRAEGRLAHVGL